MKKKLLMLFFAVISCVCLAFGFAACTGETGATGAQGEKGETGATGATGADGLSAYDVAVAAGYTGTEEEWVNSLKGADGASAYEIAVAGGYTGTEEEWVESLKGADGASAYEIAVAGGYTGTEEEWVESLNGADGNDGVGIESVVLNQYNDFVVTYTDGTSETLEYHGTKAYPYVITNTIYDSETGVFSDTFDVEAYGSVYYTLYVENTTNVIIYAGSNDTISITGDDYCYLESEENTEGVVTSVNLVSGTYEYTAKYDYTNKYWTVELAKGEYNMVITDEDGTASTVSLEMTVNGTPASPYEVSTSDCSESGSLYNDDPVDSVLPVAYELALTNSVDIYLYNVSKSATITVIGGDEYDYSYYISWDSDYGYWAGTLYVGEYYTDTYTITIADHHCDCVGFNMAIKGSSINPYTADDYYLDALAANASVYYEVSENMMYDIYSEVSGIAIMGYDENTDITMTYDEDMEWYTGSFTAYYTTLVITNKGETALDEGWYFYLSRHIGAGTEEDPYLVYASDLQDEYGNYSEGYFIEQDADWNWITLKVDESLYFSALTGGATATLYVRSNFNVLTGSDISITINGETATIAEDGTVTFSTTMWNATAASIVIKNTGTADLEYIDVTIVVKDLTVDGGSTYVCIPTYTMRGNAYDTIYKTLTISTAGTYRVYVDSMAANVSVVIDYSEVASSTDENWTAAVGWTEVTDSESSYKGYYYLEFTVTDEDLESGAIEVTIGLSAYIESVDEEGETTYSTGYTTEDLSLSYYNVEVVSVADTTASADAE